MNILSIRTSQYALSTLTKFLDYFEDSTIDVGRKRGNSKVYYNLDDYVLMGIRKNILLLLHLWPLNAPLPLAAKLPKTLS